MARKKKTSGTGGIFTAGQSGKLNPATDARPADANQTGESRRTNSSGLVAYIKNPLHWWVIGLITLLSLGAMGAGLRYLETDAERELARRKTATPLNQPQASLLSAVNPFLPNPSPTPTPQLSKEYIYAGSRMLAVEDANASAAPPADLAVWRPSTGYWYVLGGPGSQQTYFQWGGSGDVPVPGDYDGDGKTDFSVFRPSEGTWYISNSSNGAMTTLSSFGAPDDKMAQADYDGDGKTDPAVYRPNTGYWYIQQSTTNTMVSYQWGVGGHTPASADYDGDGKADIAVWYNAGASFQYLKSSTNNTTSETVQFGQTGDVPVPGDYDGDGKADYALRRGANWIIKQSSNGQITTTVWEQAGDKAVQNDYDGDGKVDIAVWRDSTGYWYIRNSSSGQLRQVQWGASGDVPVPAFYRR